MLVFNKFLLFRVEGDGLLKKGRRHGVVGGISGCAGGRHHVQFKEQGNSKRRCVVAL